MRLVPWLVVSALLAGCGGGFLSVSEARWQSVPARDRDAIEAAYRADLARADADLRAATAALATAEATAATATAGVRATPAAIEPGEQTAAADAPIATEDAWARVVGEHARAKTSAIAGVAQAKAAWATAELAWRQRRLDVATAQLEMVRADHEFQRARAVGGRIQDDYDFDIARYRGQRASAQARWYLAETRASEARTAVVQTGAGLASAKEVVATLARTGPRPARAGLPEPMQLTAWHRVAIPQRGMWLRDPAKRTCRRGARCQVLRTSVGRQLAMSSDDGYLKMAKPRGTGR